MTSLYGFNHVAQPEDFATGKPCDANGPNGSGSNKWCRYEEPHKHGSFDCDSSCPCRQSQGSGEVA